MPHARAFTIDTIPWETTHADGTRSATLVGRRDRGPFSYAFFIPAGVVDAPHSHAVDAHLVVASGALELGYGDAIRSEGLSRYPAGSFLLVPAGAVHFDGAREDTVLIGTAVGPWSTTYAVHAGEREQSGDG